MLYFLVVVYRCLFKVLWDPECLKCIPALEELAPAYPAAKFILVRADRVGIDEISREHKVEKFPTVLVFRGGEEVARVEGPDRVVGRVAEALRSCVTRNDMEVYDARSSFEAELSGAGEEEEEEEELQWTWDPEYASESIKVLNYGTVVAMVKGDEDEDGEQGAWQFCQGRDDWQDFDPPISMQLEREYRSGKLYASNQIVAMVKWQPTTCRVSFFVLFVSKEI